MESLRKDDELTIRCTREQKRRLLRASLLESRRRGQRIKPGPLLLDLGMRAVDLILGQRKAA